MSTPIPGTLIRSVASGMCLPASCVFAGLTGWRRSEIVGLTWERRRVSYSGTGRQGGDLGGDLDPGRVPSSASTLHVLAVLDPGEFEYTAHVDTSAWVPPPNARPAPATVVTMGLDFFIPKTT